MKSTQVVPSVRSESRPARSRAVRAAARVAESQRAGELGRHGPDVLADRLDGLHLDPRPTAEAGRSSSGAAVVDVDVIGVVAVVEIGEDVREPGVQAGRQPPVVGQPSRLGGRGFVAPAVVAAGDRPAVGQPDRREIEGPAGVVPGVAGRAAVGPAAVGPEALRPRCRGCVSRSFGPAGQLAEEVVVEAEAVAVAGDLVDQRRTGQTCDARPGCSGRRRSSDRTVRIRRPDRWPCSRRTAPPTGRVSSRGTVGDPDGAPARGRTPAQGRNARQGLK